MANFQQGDIVLVPFPYSDLSSSKRRPVVIISKNSTHRWDYIVVKITSVIRNDDFSFPIENEDIDRPLHRASEARTNVIFTVSKKIVAKKLATLSQAALRKLTEKVRENISVYETEINAG